MERQPGAGQGPLPLILLPAVVTEQLEFLRKTSQRMGWLLVLALLPWMLVSVGFYVFHSFMMAIILYALAGCVLPYWLFARGQGALWPLNCTPKMIILPTAATAAIMLGGWALLGDHMLDWEHFNLQTRTIGLKPGLDFWVLTSYFVLINPIVEELFWRGLVYQRFRKELGIRWALIWSSLLFGAWHWVIVQHFFKWEWQIIVTLGIVIAGVIFGAVAERTKTLGAPIIIHSLGADLPIMLILLDAFHHTGAS